MSLKLPASLKYTAFTLLLITTLYLSKLFFFTGPTLFSTHLNSKTNPLTLNGTLVSKNERTAVVNNALHHKGDVINGYQINSITKDGIQIENISSGKKIRLTINDNQL